MITLFSRTKNNGKKNTDIVSHIQEGEIIDSSPFAPLTIHTKKLLKKLINAHRALTSQTTEGTIHVSEIFGVIALVYERVRMSVEYKREHLLRRNAIERILKRLLWERQGKNLETTAHLLLRELIWAHYLPNDRVPKSKIVEIATIIQKYLSLMNLLGGYATLPQSNKEWLIGVLSTDVEESLDAIPQREMYVNLMYEWFKTHFEWRHPHLSEHEKDIQLYLAVHRSLPKSDDAIMRYHLLVKEMPQWNNPSQEDILYLAQAFSKLKEEIELHLNHAIRLPLYRYVKKHAPAFEILKETLEREGNTVAQAILDKQQLELKIRQMCQLKYNQIRKKINQGIARSIVYILVTKVVFALIIEVPYEMFFLGHLAWIPIGINVIIPPLLMFLIGLTIKIPGEDNTKRLVDRIKNIVYIEYQGRQIPFSVGIARKKSLLTTIFSIIYFVLFFITFGGISYILYLLNFTIIGAGIFFVFLSLVLLFGFRVRSTAVEMKITSDKEGLFSYILSNLSLPFLNFGVLLSKGISKINIIMVIMDFLIEAPLKTIIEVIEEWTTFAREKRDEVVEIPPE